MCENTADAKRAALHGKALMPPQALTFNRCRRGFTLSDSDYDRPIRTIYAFDKIEDLAAWLVETYGEPKAITVRRYRPKVQPAPRRRRK